MESGTLRQLESLRAEVKPELQAIGEYPKLDAKRVLRIYKKLNISSVDELRAKLESGEIGSVLGARMEQHVRQAMTRSPEMLLYEAESIVAAIKTFLVEKCGVKTRRDGG